MKKHSNISTTALTRLTTHSYILMEKSRDLFNELRQSVFSEYNIEGADQLFTRICDLSQMRLTLSELSKDLREFNSSEPVFMIGSELLYNVFNKLNSIPTESIIYGVGNRFDNTLTVERLIDLQLDKSEYGYARADISFSSKALIELEQFGSVLTCYFHAHPGHGSGANHPSDIDIHNQIRLETGNYKTVGGIFSRDGYLRFFSDKLDYRITISGKGVEHVSKDVYKLTEIR